MVLGKRKTSLSMTSGKRTFVGRTSYKSGYTPYKPRKGYYGRYYGRRSTYGFNKSYKELKFQTGYHDTTIDRQGFYQLPAPTVLMNGTTVGADVKQRIGRRIAMKNLQLFVTIQPQQYYNNLVGDDITSAVKDYSSPSVRIIVYYDRQNNGVSTPVPLGTLFDSSMTTTSIWGTTHFINCGKNLANADRFLWLLDKTYMVDKIFSKDLSAPKGDAGIWTAKPIQKRFFINMKNLVTNYNDVGATLSNINEGSLNLLIISNRDAASDPAQNNGIYTEVSWRLRFTDH